MPAKTGPTLKLPKNISLSFGAAFTFPTDIQRIAPPIANAMETYAEVAAQHLKLLGGDGLGKTSRPFDLKLLRDYHRRQIPPRRLPMGWGPAGEGGHSSPWTAIAALHQDEWVSSHLRLTWGKELAASGVSMVMDLARQLPFDTLHAGLFLNYDELGDIRASEVARAAARRYLALACCPDVLVAPGELGQIGWLTGVSNPLLERLKGGRTAVVASLRAHGIVVHEVPAGIVAQLGDRPTLGDANLPEDLTNYRVLGRIMKPLLGKRPGGRGSWSNDELRAWTRRFSDPPSKWPTPMIPYGE